MGAASERFAPAAGLPQLRQRAELLRRVRAFFDARGFLEVETPLLSTEVIAEPHIEPLGVDVCGEKRWLQASPEAHMKRLLAAGSGAIYQITRSFRDGEVGPHHNPEFSILEWYHPADSVEEGITQLAEFSAEILNRRPQVISYRELFRRHLSIDPIAAETDQLASLAQELGCPDEATQDPWTREDWLDWMLVTCVEPHLSGERPWIVRDYPPSQAALARIGTDQFGDAVAERFELYLHGVELANGYYELTDPTEQRRRLASVQDDRRTRQRPPLPSSDMLLAALEHGMPAAAGVACGLDRLAMVLAGGHLLSQVVAFPWDRA